MEKVDFYTLFHETRARVYLSWALITGIGYVATHFYQNKNINFVWFALSVAGFSYMYKVMPLRVRQMKYIYLSWLIPISIGLLVSIVSVRTDLIPSIIAYLGAFWLLVSAVGYFWNGLFDSPGLWYYIAAGVNFVAAAVIYASDSLLVNQYLIAAVVSVWSMLMLWVYRSDD